MLAEQFTGLIEALQVHPGLQMLVTGTATWFLEDPVSIACGLMVARRDLDFWVAFVGLWVGITSGDAALYLFGRFAQRLVLRRGWVSTHRLLRAENRYRDHVVRAIFSARFIPGTRMATFVGAGVLRAPFGRFVLLAGLAALLQTTLLLGAARMLGEAVLPYLGDWRLEALFGLALVAAVFGVHLAFGRRRKLREEVAPLADEAAPCSSFEFWHPALFYIPVILYYLRLAVRYRGLMLPLVANPKIYNAGLVRESKSQIYALFPPAVARQWVGQVVVVPAAPRGTAAATRLAVAGDALQKAGLAFPLVAKPDVGQRGAGVRRVRDLAELAAYLRHYPVTQPLILQELIDYPYEAGILYVRRPQDATGWIFSVTLKEFHAVTGDGSHTVRELILAQPRCRRLARTFFAKQRDQLERVLPAGEVLQLNFAGNHAQGTVFRDGNQIVTPALTARFHAISEAIGDFHFGRYDIRYRSLAELQAGEGFKIIELNGAGAEATHIWDGRARLREAYRVLFEQFRLLFEIGASNRRAGYEPVPAWRFVLDFLAVRRLIRRYPPAE